MLFSSISALEKTTGPKNSVGFSVFPSFWEEFEGSIKTVLLVDAMSETGSISTELSASRKSYGYGSQWCHNATWRSDDRGHEFFCKSTWKKGRVSDQQKDQNIQIFIITYLPHKAVAEASRDKEPIGRGCVEFNCFESQLMSDSSEVRFKWFGLSSDLRFKRFGCQSMCFTWFWLCVDLSFKWVGCQLIWDSSDLVVNRSEIQMSWLSVDLRFKWVGCQLVWDSIDLDVTWFEVQVIWLSTDVWFKWFCQTKLLCEASFKNESLKIKNEAILRDFLQNWNCEAQKRSFSARLPSKMKLWSSKTKHFCQTPFKNEALKLKNEAFLRDFLQNWSFEDQKTKHFCETSFKIETVKLKIEAFLRDFLPKWSFEAQKRSISARLPSKMKLWNSKTKLFCETSFKIEALKIKNETFLRDFLQNWHVEQTLDLRIPIRFSDFQVDASKVLRLPRKSWAEAYEVL